MLLGWPVGPLHGARPWDNPLSYDLDRRSRASSPCRVRVARTVLRDTRKVIEGYVVTIKSSAGNRGGFGSLYFRHQEVSSHSDPRVPAASLPTCPVVGALARLDDPQR
jgi:hypothetical protein